MGNMTDYTAELIMASGDQAKRPKPGRPAIEDETLVNRREQLVFLLETTWQDIGERLPWLKRPDDVLQTLQVWKDHNWENQYYVAQLLLRPSSVTATATELTTLRHQLKEANIAVRNAFDFQETCQKARDTAQRALSDQLTEIDKVKVQDQIFRRTEKLAKAEADYSAADDARNTAQAMLSEAESSFARTEFTRFIKSERYRLTPLNLANALAGLPDIGWRQSALRWKKHPADGSDGLSMQIFKGIRRIVDSCPRRSDLIGHAQRWLSNKKNRKSLGAEELGKKFYYLRWAIKTVLEAENHVTTRQLPFAITREYWNRIKESSSVDQLFEEEERIVD